MNFRDSCFALLTLAFSATLPSAVFAASETTSAVHPYKIGDAAYEGYVARPAALAKDAVIPAVLVVHDWTGNGEFSQAKADHMARLGYIAFAVDMYGKGIRAPQSGAPNELAGVLYKNPALFRERITAALEELKKQPGVDATRIGAIGFCFGGTTVLELARSGADVKGVVSFHGGLKPFNATAKNAVKARVTILHGVRDPHVPPADVAACMTDLNDAGAWFQFVGFPNAVHSFTNPAAGDDPTKGSAYDAAADKGSFATMEGFFRTLFAVRKPAN